MGLLFSLCGMGLHGCYQDPGAEDERALPIDNFAKFSAQTWYQAVSRKLRLQVTSMSHLVKRTM